MQKTFYFVRILRGPLHYMPQVPFSRGAGPPDSSRSSATDGPTSDSDILETSTSTTEADIKDQEPAMDEAIVNISHAYALAAAEILDRYCAQASEPASDSPLRSIRTTLESRRFSELRQSSTNDFFGVIYVYDIYVK